MCRRGGGGGGGGYTRFVSSVPANLTLPLVGVSVGGWGVYPFINSVRVDFYAASSLRVCVGLPLCHFCAGQLYAATSECLPFCQFRANLTLPVVEGGVYPFVSSSVPVSFTLPLVGVYPFVSSVPARLTLPLVGGGLPLCQ